MQFRKAERRKSKLRLAIAGPSGSGKTVSSLLIAYGLCGDWDKIGLIDTENGSGDLYANTTIGDYQIGEYNILTLEPPYTPQKYISAIKAAEQAGLEVLIIDSASHAWAGEGGLLDQHGRIADSGKMNSFAAWRQITPLHNKLVETMLRSNLHLIVTLRAKTEYVVTQEKGKTEVKKVGLAPVQRDGFEYEFTVFLDIAADHTAYASKDRTSLLDGQYFIPTPETGQMLRQWLESGVDKPEPQCAQASAVEENRVTNINSQKVTQPQLSKIHVLLDQLGATEGDIAALKETFRVESWKELSRINASKLIDALEKRKEKMDEEREAAEQATEDVMADMEDVFGGQ